MNDENQETPNPQQPDVITGTDQLPNQTSPAVLQPNQAIGQTKKRKHPVLRIVVGVFIVLVIVVILLVVVFSHANSEAKAAEAVGTTFLQDG